MMKWRIGAAIALLIIMSPLIYLNFWGFKMSMWVNDVTVASENGEPITEMPEMPASPFDWFRNKAETRFAFSQTEFSNVRSVDISETIPLSVLLRDGEAVPDEVIQPLYAEARAPRYMVKYCTEILAELGSQCKIDESNSKMNSDGTFTLNARLEYLPSYDLGQPEKVSGGTMVTTNVPLFNVTTVTELPPNDATQRRAIMAQVRDICVSVRERFGSCIVTKVEFSPMVLPQYQLDNLPEGTNPERLNVRAKISIYGQKNRETKDALRNMLEKLVQNS